MNAPLLRVSSVCRTLGTTRALDHVSLEVHAGAIVGLLGPNGAGKTTLVRVVMGLAAADSGDVALNLPPRPPGHGGLGYLPEERGLYQRHRVYETLVYLGQLRGLPAGEARREVAGWLERLEMSGYASRRLEQLSKGQQQKIQLAAALVGDPDLLVFDEPFSGLDPLNARLTCDLLHAAASEGRGVLVSAHQLALLEQTCTDLVMLADGRVVLAGSMPSLRRDHREPLESLFVTLASGGRR
jgi:ABC-2 type transport system ATP-binding protein